MRLLLLANPVAAIFITLLLLSSSSPNTSSDNHHVQFIRGATSLGINYGQVGNDLPPPQKVITLIQSLNITKVRIYDTNPQVLTAFANTNIELIVTIENDLLPSLSPQSALNWVSTRIKPYFPATRITGIAVGNEIFTDENTSLTPSVVPAMIAIHSALLQLGLSQYITVSSPNSLAVLAVSYPPSSGIFRPELIPVMSQFLNFLNTINSPFWINAYPYFAYKDQPSKISLDYALSNPTSSPGMTDPSTKLHYDNMLYAQVDSAIFAIARMGYTSIEVKVSETGWPSKGDTNEVGANVQNAAVYNRNLLRRQMVGEGTPVRPNSKLDVYMFALFNEDMKPGPTSERNYGLFHPDCTMAYNVGISSTLMSTSQNGDSGSNSSPGISLTSSGSKARKMGSCQSLVYWTFVYLLLHYFKFLQQLP